MKKFLSLIVALILVLAIPVNAAEPSEKSTLTEIPDFLFIEHMGELKSIAPDKLTIIDEYKQEKEFKISHKTMFLRNTGTGIDWERMNVGDIIKVYELEEGIAFSIISYGNKTDTSIPAVSMHIATEYEISEDKESVIYKCENENINISVPISNISESWNNNIVENIPVPKFVFLSWYDVVLDKDSFENDKSVNTKEASTDKIIILKYLSQEPLLIFKENNKLIASYVDKFGNIQEKEIGEYRIFDDIKYVPLRLALENLGNNYKVGWNSENGDIYIYYNDKKFSTKQDYIELYTQGIILHMDGKIIIDNGTTYISSKTLSKFFDIGNIYVK